MYLRSAVAGLLVVAVSGQLCGVGNDDQCGQDLEACSENVKDKIGAQLKRIPGQFARGAIEKAGERVSDFFANPFQAVQHAIEEDTQNIRQGFQATTAVTKILTNSIEPLLEVFKPAAIPQVTPLVVPIKLILQTMVVLKSFLDDEQLRNNTEIEKILDFVIPVIQTVNDDGVRCFADAVGGLMKYPFLGMAFVVGRILDYMLNCYSSREAESSGLCMIETTVVKIVLEVGVWILSAVLKFMP